MPMRASPTTTPTSSGGTCIQDTGATVCYDDYQIAISLSSDWQEEVVLYGALSQQGWGTRANFDPATLIGMNFQTLYGGGESFSFSIDDVSFY